MSVKKAVITAAGKGSRMKYITSVLPKALLPLFKGEDGKIVMRPIIDLIMESLNTVGVEKFCIVVGKHGKLLMDYLFEREVTFVFQKEPKGFGDAVLKAEDFVGSDPFFVHADDGVLTGGYRESTSLFNEIKPDAVLLLREVKNPKRYGVVAVQDKGDYMGHKLFKVVEAEEKPENPKSNIAISAVYIFTPKLFRSLKAVTVEGEKELELTYGIQGIINDGGEVYGILLKDEKWLNVGDPASYHEALMRTFTSST
ncbi:nucleotidyltransferase family protein [Stygiolobus caldivivus]|uniref:UTP--glucose-1-phosphate uridylyltransferase n=1 Tax=Stygiolobus caldivivus TaxID=2824673 RepID=A0A8D5U5E1_9CREN|nr:sugar phosphate nucleotidyltransferase [Stygiolobus caldivivus]BCU69383.1 nucleotidyltransferase [Stygiolobus caldivivus]